MKFEEQGQLQLVEREDIEDEDELFKVIDKLVAQGINAGDVKKLQDAGIYTCNGLMMHTKKNLTGIKGLSEAKVDKICEAAEKIVNFGYITGSDALTKRKSIVKITTRAPMSAMANKIHFCTMVVLALLTTTQATTSLWIPPEVTPFHETQELSPPPTVAASPISPPSAAVESPLSPQAQSTLLWTPSSLASTHQPQEEEYEEPRTTVYQIVEIAMRYGLPTIGILVILIVLYSLYKSYPNTFRILSIYGLLHYFGFGASVPPALPVANPSFIVGVISAGGGIILTFLRWVARRPSGAIAATETVITTTIPQTVGGRIAPQFLGERMWAFVAVAVAGTLAAYAGGPWVIDRARAAAGGSYRAGAAAYRFLTSPFQRGATAQDLEMQPFLRQPTQEDDLEIQPISRRLSLSPKLTPNKPGLLQLIE